MCWNMYAYLALPLGQLVQLDGAQQLQGALRALRLAVWPRAGETKQTVGEEGRAVVSACR